MPVNGQAGNDELSEGPRDGDGPGDADFDRRKRGVKCWDCPAEFFAHSGDPAIS